MAKKKQNKNPAQLTVSYGIDRIETAKFFYEYPSIEIINKPFEVNFTYQPSMSFSVDQNLIFIQLIIKGNILESGNQVIFIDNVFGFKVENLKQYTTQKDGQGKLIDEFESYLIVFVSISISTTRGILLEKLSGTVYHGKVLPIIDPSVFFKKSK